jgi:hypothetical protein
MALIVEQLLSVLTKRESFTLDSKPLPGCEPVSAWTRLLWLLRGEAREVLRVAFAFDMHTHGLLCKFRDDLRRLS